MTYHTKKRCIVVQRFFVPFRNENPAFSHQILYEDVSKCTPSFFMHKAPTKSAPSLETLVASTPKNPEQEATLSLPLRLRLCPNNPN